MDAVGLDRQRDVHPIVDEEERTSATRLGPQRPRDLQRTTGAALLLAYLQDAHPGVESRQRDLLRVAAGAQAFLGHQVDAGLGKAPPPLLAQRAHARAPPASAPELPSRSRTVARARVRIVSLSSA